MDTRRLYAGELRGWTLLELVMSASILLVVIAAVLNFLSLQTDFWEYSTTQTDVRSDLEHAMDAMARELRSAQRVTPGSSPSITIPNAPDNTTMTLYVPTAVDSSTGIITWSSAIQYTYDPASQQLRRVQDGITRILASNVTSAAFTDKAIDSTLYSNEVKVAVTLQRTTPHQRAVTVNASTIVRLRN